MAASFDPTGSSIRIQRMLNARRPPVSTSKLTPIATPTFHAARIGRAIGGPIDSPAAPITGPIITTGGGRTDDHPVHVPSGAYVLPADVVSHIGEGNSLAGMKLLTDMFGAPWSAKGGPLGAMMPKMVQGPGPGKPSAPYPAMALPMPKPGAMYASGGVAPINQLRNEDEYQGFKSELQDLQEGHDNEPPRKYVPSNGILKAHSMMTAAGGHVHDTGEATPIMISGGEFVISPDEVRRRGNGNMSKGHKTLDAWVVHLRKKSIDTLKKLPGPAK